MEANEQGDYSSAVCATRPNADVTSGADPVAATAVAPDREVIKARLRARLADAEAEANPAKVLIENFKRQWCWLGIEEGQPVEVQQLAPKAPDEQLGEALRSRNRHDPSKGEYRPMNRYARVHGLRQALVLLAHAAEHYQAQGLYVLGNRLKKAVADKARTDVWISFAKDSGTTDADIGTRCVVMLDVDPKRQDGVKDVSATDEERRSAIERALDLYADLVQILGSDRCLAFVSSGNGAQVHVRINMPNTPEVTRAVKRLLLILDKLYSTDTEELDTGVFDGKRLFPACGTWKKKGASNPASGRVHRPSLFLPGAGQPDVLSVRQVERVLATFEARVSPEQRSAVEKDMGGPGQRPATGTSSQRPNNGGGESDFAKANALPVSDVALKLGLDPEHLACPACGATSNVDSLESKGINVIKCPHSTCGGRVWRPVDLVAKLVFRCDDLKGSRGVAPDVLGWFADNFGLDIKPSKKTAGKPTTEETAARDTHYAEMIAELRVRGDRGHAGARTEPPQPAPPPDATSDGHGEAPPDVIPEPEPVPSTAPGPRTTTPPPASASGSGSSPLSDSEIDERLRAVVGRSALERETAVNLIHGVTGKTKGALRARLKELEAERASQIAEEAAAVDTADGVPCIQSNEYIERAGCTCLVVHDAKLGDQAKQIANFVARITREVTVDDGVTASKAFTVVGTLATGTPLPSIDVPAAKWSDKCWLADHWGSRPVVEAGRDSWAHMLAAVQKSSTPATATTYQHTGWRKVGERMAYLFPGSSVGASNVDVRNPDDGNRYGLPIGEASKEDEMRAIRTSISLLLLDPTVTVVAVAAAYTAPLSTVLDVDFGVWFAGESGACKSGLAALALCHFGAFSYSSLPMSWASTVNAIEAFLFRTKDTLSVVDNYLPGDKDASAKVNRIVQQIGDRGGRGRLSKDSSAMPARPPRGLMLASGEDVPVGSSDSTVGRLVIRRMKRDDALRARIIAASSDSGDYAIAMRAYLVWFAVDHDMHARDARSQRDHLIPQIESRVREHGVHPRTARSVAALGAGVTSFLTFALEVGAISAAEHEAVQRVADHALAQVAQEQGSFRENATPVDRYLSTVRALLLQKSVTLADRASDLDVGTGIGWQDDDFVYLEPDLAWRAVETFHAQGQKWAYSKTGMHQALIDAGVVLRGEPGRATTKRRVGAGQGTTRVLLVHREHLADAIRVAINYREFGTDDGDDAGSSAH